MPAPTQSTTSPRPPPSRRFLPAPARSSSSPLTPSGREGSGRRERSGSGAMGVELQTITPGDGRTFPKAGQVCVVHYVGSLMDGTKFDSSRDRNKPFEFKIGQREVIKGWDEGLAQMSVGQRAKLTCTPDYAYGALGHPDVIPPHATLIFDVELLRIK